LFKFMRGEKYMHFANICVLIPFTLLFFIEGCYSSLHFTNNMLLYFYFSHWILEFQFIFPWNWVPHATTIFVVDLWNYYYIISLIAFSFNLDRYFQCFGEARPYHLGL
jgi:hypothetical protein